MTDKTDSARVPPLRERLLSGGIWAIGGRGVNSLAMLAVYALLARLLSPTELGAYFLALSMVTLGAMVGTLGLHQAVVRFVAESVGLNQLGRTRRVVVMVFGIGGSGALSVGLVYVLFGDFLGANLFHAPALVAVTGLVAGWMVVLTLQSLLAETFRGFYDIREASIFGGLVTSVLLACWLALVWLVWGQTSLTIVLFFVVGSGLASILLGGWALYRKVLSLPSQEVESAQTQLSIREILRVSWPLLGGSMTIFLLTQADVWILGIFRPEEEVAIYATGSRLAMAALILTWVVYAVLPPLIAEKYAAGEMAILERLLRTSATVSAIMALPLFGVFILLPDQVLGWVYGSFYEGGGWVLGLLSLGLLVNAVTGIHGSVLTMTGNERTHLVLLLMSGAANVALCTLGAIYWGIYGVAFAAMSTMILQCLAEIIAIYFRLGIRTYASLSSVRDIKKLLVAQMRAYRR